MDDCGCISRVEQKLCPLGDPSANHHLTLAIDSLRNLQHIGNTIRSEMVAMSFRRMPCVRVTVGEHEHKERSKWIDQSFRHHRPDRFFARRILQNAPPKQTRKIQ